MDYLLIFIFCYGLGFLISFSFLLKNAKVISMTALLKDTFAYGFTISLVVVITYYLYT